MSTRKILKQEIADAILKDNGLAADVADLALVSVWSLPRLLKVGSKKLTKPHVLDCICKHMDIEDTETLLIEVEADENLTFGRS